MVWLDAGAAVEGAAPPLVAAAEAAEVAAGVLLAAAPLVAAAPVVAAADVVAAEVVALLGAPAELLEPPQPASANEPAATRVIAASPRFLSAGRIVLMAMASSLRSLRVCGPYRAPGGSGGTAAGVRWSVGYWGRGSSNSHRCASTQRG